MPRAVTSNGDLHYEVIDHVAPWHAPAQTVVFHHGIGAAPGIWRKWLPALVDRYRVVTFDMRGYGRSEQAGRNISWTLEQLVDDVFAIADDAGLDRFHLAGESIGGTIGLECLLRKPGRIGSLTVSNGAHVGTNIQKVQHWASQMAQHGIKGWSDQFLDDRFYADALPPEERAWYAQAQERWDGQIVLQALSVLVGTDLSARIPAIGAPVLLMHGDSSPFIPVSVMAELNSLLPNSSFHVFGHARHGLPFSHAKQCASLLREFLDGLPQAAQADAPSGQQYSGKA